jgi:hypothetical protein
MKKLLIPVALAAACAVCLAKLPPPDDATKAKAAETTAKAAWQAKVDAYQLCKVQDKIGAKYRKTSAAEPAAASKDAKPVATAAATSVAAASPAAPIAPATTAAAAPPAPCAEPGAFTYTPPEQKPLETSGAHSPAGTAASPPSVKPQSAEMTPAKK